MPTLSKHEMISILSYLDDAAAALPASTVPGLETTAAWNLRIARRRLYEAAVGEVTVEALPPAANETGVIAKDFARWEANLRRVG